MSRQRYRRCASWHAQQASSLQPCCTLTSSYWHAAEPVRPVPCLLHSLCGIHRQVSLSMIRACSSTCWTVLQWRLPALAAALQSAQLLQCLSSHSFSQSSFLRGSTRGRCSSAQTTTPAISPQLSHLHSTHICNILQRVTCAALAADMDRMQDWPLASVSVQMRMVALTLTSSRVRGSSSFRTLACTSGPLLSQSAIFIWQSSCCGCKAMQDAGSSRWSQSPCHLSCHACLVVHVTPHSGSALSC